MALNDPPPRHATPALAGRLSALGLVLSLLLQGCGQQKGLCEKGDATCKELQALQQSLGSCNELHPDSRFVGNPKITDISGTCAAVEFLYASQQMPVVYLYGRVARDADFTAEWGEGLHPLELEGESPEMAELKGKLPPELKVRRYRTLMRHIPTHKAFEVKLADEEDAAFEGSAFSCSSEPEVTLPKKLHPAAPYEVQLHRTDPRTNVKNEEGSVCVDLHWSHPFPQLKLVPEDAYFRVWMQYEGEPKKQFCEDQLGVWKRRCGVQMPSASGAFGRQSFTTICGLWPSRRVTFTVEAFTCDGRAAADVITATLPPDAPSFTASLITTPANQESSAGFWPKVLIDWIPQHDDLIQGHSLYLSLKGIGAMKLICWISRQERRGQMSLPIQKKNHTHSRDAALLHDYLQRYHVHQEQEVLVATRSVANISRPGRNKEKDEFLESPVSAFSLGDWLIMEKYVKCLTSFNAQQPSYVSSAVQLSWTEEQSMNQGGWILGMVSVWLGEDRVKRTEATPARDGHRKRGDEANEANGAKERAAVDCLGFLNPQLVREAIRPLFPESDVCGFVSGELEGSRAFRVAVPDIELVVSVSPELLRQKLLGKLERKLDKQLEKAAIRSIAEILVTSCGFKFRRSAFRGEEPKLTLLAPGGDAEAVPLDLAVNAETPLYAAALLSECAQWDLRAKQLILLVRRWAKDRGICHAAKGYLSPYHWSLLVIYFLQVCPRVLPPLTAFMAFQQLSSKGSASSPDDAPRPEPNPVHTSKLFKDFMHFYQDFDWRNEMINPISGSPGKSTFEDSSSPLILQDPFRPLNLGRRISTSSFARTQEEFARAGAICAEGVAVGRIFELWVPPTGDAEED
ncbi:Caffeine-induced protein 16 [Durusdinium trenchii]|uniref:Caffeine-induced protein 16 n=1 Tax=Durusdinium trenchii TaxID=1381693 RepID=A0ABP0SPV5_9DINO